MEYHEYLSEYEYARRMGQTTLDCDAFYTNRRKLIQLSQIDDNDEMTEAQLKLVQLAGEHQWYSTERPYVLVHHRIIETFCETQIDAGASQAIEMPFDSFVLQLPKEKNTLQMFNRYVDADASGPFDVKTIFVNHLYKEKNHRLSLFLNLDLKNNSEIIEMGYFEWRDDDPEQITIEELMDNQDARSPGLRRVLRLVISTGILIARGNPLIEPHVLNVDLGKFYVADKEQQKRLINKAIRRRKKRGYQFGVDRQFSVGLMVAPLKQKQNDPQHTREPLTQAHFRKGFWKRVWYGPQSSLCRIDWFMPTIVRPDLPFQPKK